jgi:hypothetical protein
MSGLYIVEKEGIWKEEIVKIQSLHFTGETEEPYENP